MPETADLPLVSCMMVTTAHKSRWPFIAACVKCFADQTYSAKELIVILDDASYEDEAFVRQELQNYPGLDFHLEAARPKISLGALRNLALIRSRGSLICQWDDDDLYHPDRIRYQMQALMDQQVDAVFLQNVFHYFADTQEVYLSKWAGTKMRGHPATVLYRKSVNVAYQEVGQYAERNEDAYAQGWLKENVQVAFLDNPPQMYTYIFHGQNNCNGDHHRMVAHRLGEGREQLLHRKGDLVHLLAEAGLGGVQLRVCDKDGTVFRIQGMEALDD